MSLTNKDFRVLMMTPRPGAAPARPRQISRPAQQESAPPPDDDLLPGETDGAAERENERLRKQVRKQQRQQLEGAHASGTAAAAGNARYRDRAKERRATDGGGGGNAANPEAIDTSGMSAEETKFLGGDEEHTHLVKGLDFALLAQKRKEIADEEEQQQKEQQRLKEATEEREASDEGNGSRNAAAAEMARRIQAVVNGDYERSLMPQKSMVAVPSFGFESQSPFASGRVAYRYTFTNVAGGSCLPTTLVRGRNERGAHEDEIVATSAERIIFSKIATIMAKREKAKRQHQQQQQQQVCQTIESAQQHHKKKEEPAKAVEKRHEKEEDDDDGSIFPGLEEYRPAAAAAGGSASVATAPGKQQYFEHARDEEAPKVTAEGIDIAAMITEVREEQERADELESTTKAAEPTAGMANHHSADSKAEEEYAEYYPGAYELGSFWDFKASDVAAGDGQKGGPRKGKAHGKEQQEQPKKVPDEKQRAQKVNRDFDRVKAAMEAAERKKRAEATDSHGEADDAATDTPTTKKPRRP